MMKFYKKLGSWYLENKRSMPWRATRNPYHIWLSEVMLQQTRVEQGLPYYLKFTTAFPTVFDLANASEKEVLKLWQGLGYYSRARNLHATAKYVATTGKGVFPKSYNELLQLKGVGEYTASAIASICYKEAVPVVDGNVYRVLSRYYGIVTPIDSTTGIKEFKALAKAIMDAKNPGDYNQALMEFGALQCKPKNPNCTSCPLRDGCVALGTNKVSELPVKIKKLKVKKRYFNYLVFVIHGEHTIIQQRTGKGIWQNMYEFPLIETPKAMQQEDLVALQEFKEMVGKNAHSITLYNEEYKIHKLSHQHLYTRFYSIETSKAPVLTATQSLVARAEIAQYPVPVLVDQFIKAYAF